MNEAKKVFMQNKTLIKNFREADAKNDKFMQKYGRDLLKRVNEIDDADTTEPAKKKAKKAPGPPEEVVEIDYDSE